LVADVIGFGLIESATKCVQGSFGGWIGFFGHGRKVGF